MARATQLVHWPVARDGAMEEQRRKEEIKKKEKIIIKKEKKFVCKI